MQTSYFVAETGKEKNKKEAVAAWGETNQTPKEKLTHFQKTKTTLIIFGL
jgi:hypothetical protein